MITFLHGKLTEALSTQVTLDVHGIGYEVLIPLSSFDKLPPPGGEVKLLTQLVVREDAPWKTAQDYINALKAAPREPGTSSGTKFPIGYENNVNTSAPMMYQLET